MASRGARRPAASELAASADENLVTQEETATKSVARTRQAPTLDYLQGLHAMDRLIEAVSTEEFQKNLAALHATKPWLDSQQMFKMRRALTNSVGIPIVADYGFEASDEGMTMFMRTLIRPPFRATAKVLERHYALTVLLNLDAEAVDDFDSKAPKFGRIWVITKKCPKGGVLVFESLIGKGKPASTQLHADAVLQEFGQENGHLRFRKLQGSGPTYGWVQIIPGIIQPQEEAKKQ